MGLLPSPLLLLLLLSPLLHAAVPVPTGRFRVLEAAIAREFDILHETDHASLSQAGLKVVVSRLLMHACIAAAYLLMML